MITKPKPVITGPKRRAGFGLAVVLRMFSTMGSSLFPFLETKAMPAHRTSMRKLKEVLRLKWACGVSHRQIGRAVGISVGAISECAALATAAGLDWPGIEPLSDDEIEQRLLPKAATGEPVTSSRRIQPDFTLIHRELRRKGVTLQLLWEEYVDAHAASRTYRYTQFCQLYKDWVSTILRIGADSNGSSPADP